MKGLLKAIQKLSNYNDLTNLLEIKDTEDELGILRDLFTTQKEVIEQMIDAYGSIDKLQAETERHGRAITWLQDAQLKVASYIKKVDKLIGQCKDVEKGVSSH